jgi:hypothetical protein
MNRKTLLSIGSALVAIGVMSVAGYGCGDDDSTATTKTDSGTTPETSTPETGTPDTGTKNPAPPTLGAQIDRMGRPAINTALNNVFNADPATQGAAKDKYNQDSDQANWGKTYIGETSKNLAILDSLDGVCGNQLFADSDAGSAGPNFPNLKVYGTLGGVTADDRLWLNAAGTSCDVYLAVEANATKFSPNTDCGGRALKYDVIDITYSAAALGAIAGGTDGIDADPIKTAATAFPFLAAPTP